MRMSTPKGTRCTSFKLGPGQGLWVYSNGDGIHLQIRREVPTEQDVASPSFKVAVKLKPADALKLAGELLTVAGTMLRQ
jgi:hypothetical protein